MDFWIFFAIISMYFWHFYANISKCMVNLCTWNEISPVWNVFGNLTAFFYFHNILSISQNLIFLWNLSLHSLLAIVGYCGNNHFYCHTPIWNVSPLPLWSQTVNFVSVNGMLILLFLLLLLLLQVFTSSQSQICLSVRFGFVHCFICICM